MMLSNASMGLFALITIGAMISALLETSLPNNNFNGISVPGTSLWKYISTTDQRRNGNEGTFAKDKNSIQNPIGIAIACCPCKMNSKKSIENPSGIAIVCAYGKMNDIFAKPPERIMGSTGVDPDQFHFIVTLGYPGSFGHRCGGAIVSPRHIITAAHCLPSTNSSQFVVRSGIHDLYDVNAIVSTVKNHFIHPNYVPYWQGDYGVQNDIGIILLNHDLDLDGVVSQISLPIGPPDYDKYCSVAGWGRTERTGHQFILQMASGITLLRERECSINGGIPQQPEKLCGYKYDATLCSGDSGSPLVSGGRIVGVASTSTCIVGRPHTYTNVYHYIDWINLIINQTSG